MAPLKLTTKSTKRKPTDDAPTSPSRSKKNKPSTNQKEPSPDPQSSHSDVEEDEKEIELHGLTSDEEDSSDDEIAGPIEGIDITKLPTVAKDDKSVQRRLDKAKRHPTEYRGVIYIGRLPHGFYEDQLKAYFSQFGEVTRLRVSRNKKTGQSKHYAFLEFESSSVAQIVADTMDNYLLMGHILRCKVIPKDEVHPELWVGANRKWRVVPRDRVARVEQSKLRTPEEQDKAVKRLIKRQNEKKRKLEAAGIKYDFDAVAYVRVST